MDGGIVYVDELEINKERVFIRVDFNVPQDETGFIVDDRRIRAALPTINYLLDRDCIVVLSSHMGRPKSKRIKNLSLSNVAIRLSRLIEREVKFVDDCIGEKVTKEVSRAKFGSVILLENLRFYEGETKNDREFAKELCNSSLCNIYVNDAFAVAHRLHSSVSAIVEFFKECSAGFLMKKEISAFKRILENPKRPLVAVIGGAKVSDKIGALEHLTNIVDKLIIGGAMAFTFLEADGYSAGKSLVEEDKIEIAREISKMAKAKKVKLYFPVDCVIAKSKEDAGQPKVVPVQEIPEDMTGLDIGPATITLFGEALADARTIIWNGPMGVFEIEQFSKGTYSIASYIANSTAFTVVGGGDTDVALYNTGEIHKISYVSTGGGAFITVLEGRELPAIIALKERCAKKN